MQSHLDRQAMDSLGKDREIQDEVIRAILGLEWASQGTSTTTFVVDPVFNDPNFDNMDIDGRAIKHDEESTMPTQILVTASSSGPLDDGPD